MTSRGLNALQLHSEEQFQIWLASDLEARDELYALLGSDPGTGLDSLDAVETYLLSKYRTPAKILAIGERAILDAAARHVGLVMLLSLDGAEWAIELEDDDNAYYRLPMIRMDAGEECPLTMLTAALDRRKPGYLRGVAEAYLDE